MENLQYPIGKYETQPFSAEQKTAWLNELANLPEQLEAALLNLDTFQLQTPYRPGGWTVQQVVHHIADSHINAFCRFKLTLSETDPVIRPYDEKLWSLQADVELPVNISVTLLHALHRRLVALLNAVSDEEFESRGYFHPETGKRNTLWYLLGMYAWHGKHHVAHINHLRERENW